MANEKAKSISTRTKTAIKSLVRPFMAYVNQYGALAVTRAELAPKFMKAFGWFTSETGGSFIDFVRAIDPTVPAKRDEYKANKSYAAADYLRRLSSRTDTGTNRAKPVRSNLTVMARLLKTVEPLVSDLEAFWKGVSAEFALTPRQVTKLRQVVNASQPLIKLTVSKTQPAKIIHVAADGQVSPRPVSRAA